MTYTKSQTYTLALDSGAHFAAAVHPHDLMNATAPRASVTWSPTSTCSS